MVMAESAYSQVVTITAARYEFSGRGYVVLVWEVSSQNLLEAHGMRGLKEEATSRI